ncbi:MAG: metal ABC transporter substrate-binding protein [Deltaproteobacteria bacterium]|jgi:ABC-type Zn uptake system ZnuABC Zn-binding protein ZnuA|nr:metal ABC transporter substrate-binding protein [Deltaproteobacteria bacterium]
MSPFLLLTDEKPGAQRPRLLVANLSAAPACLDDLQESRTASRARPSTATAVRSAPLLAVAAAPFVAVMALVAAAAHLALPPGVPGGPAPLLAQPGPDLEPSAPRLAAASYPVWLFARYLNSGREAFSVELMTRPETGCPHEFNPQPRDLERLTQTKTLVKNGLDLEIYLARAIRVAPPDVFVIDASESVPTMINSYGRLSIPGEPSPAAALEPNPHIFLSPRLAALMAANVAKGMSERDPDGAMHYQSRLELFQADMRALEADLATFKKTRRGYKIVTSHGFMDYLAQDLGLTILADLEPAPEVAPSPARLKKITDLVRDERVAAVLLDPHADLKLAQTLGQETAVPVAVVDPVTSGPADPPLNYYQSVLREDLRVLGRLFPVNAS